MSAEFLIRLRSQNGNIVDLAGNNWSIYNVTADSQGLYFNGSSSSYMTMSDSSKSLGSGDFTISMWVKMIQTVTYSSVAMALLNNIMFWVHNAEVAKGGIGSTTAWQMTNLAVSMYQPNKLIHVALVRYNGVVKLYIDGTLSATKSDWIGNNNLSSVSLGITTTSPNNSYLYGYLNDVCVIKGYAVWTSNFTPPTGYLSLNDVVYLSGQEAWGIDSGGTFSRLSQDYSSMTDAQKIAMFNDTNYKIPTISQLKTLTMPIKAVSYCDDTTSKACKLNAVPKDQLVLPKNLINLSSIEHINSVTVTASESGTGKVRIAITKGNNVWYMFDRLNFVQIGNTASDFLADGNTASEINNITQAQWDSFGADEIGFGYVLHIENTTDVANVDNLSMSVLAKGSWNKAVYGTDYTYGYPANNTLRVDILADGDYKINYAK